MRQEIEKTNYALNQPQVEGFDLDKIKAAIGSITHRAGQVWQDQNRVQILHF